MIILPGSPDDPHETILGGFRPPPGPAPFPEPPPELALHGALMRAEDEGLAGLAAANQAASRLSAIFEDRLARDYAGANAGRAVADIADLFGRYERQTFAELPEGARSTFAENWAATRESLSESLFRHVAAERGKALRDEARKGVAQSIADAARAHTNPEALKLAIAAAENGLRLAGRFLPEGGLEQHIAQARSGIVSAVLEKHIQADPTGAFPRLARLEAMLTETDRATLREKLAAAQRRHQEGQELARLFETPPEDRDAIGRRAATIADPSLRDSVAAKAHLRFAADQAAATAEARQRDRDRQEAYADLIGRAASGKLETGEIDEVMADPRWRPDELRRIADAFGRDASPQPEPVIRPDRKEGESDADWARRIGFQLVLQSDPPILTGEILDWSHARLNAGDAGQQIETARLIRGLGPDMTRNLPQADLTYALKLAAYADAGIDPDKATALARKEAGPSIQLASVTTGISRMGPLRSVENRPSTSPHVVPAAGPKGEVPTPDEATSPFRPKAGGAGGPSPGGALGPHAIPRQTQGEIPGPPASSFHGSRRSQIMEPDASPPRNRAGDIDGRPYSGHAFDQMQNRGIPPSAVENAIKNGTSFPGKRGTTVYYDAENGISVRVNDKTGNIITIIPGKQK